MNRATSFLMIFLVFLFTLGCSNKQLPKKYKRTNQTATKKTLPKPEKSRLDSWTNYTELKLKRADPNAPEHHYGEKNLYSRLKNAQSRLYQPWRGKTYIYNVPKTWGLLNLSSAAIETKGRVRKITLNLTKEHLIKVTDKEVMIVGFADYCIYGQSSGPQEIERNYGIICQEPRGRLCDTRLTVLKFERKGDFTPEMHSEIAKQRKPDDKPAFDAGCIAVAEVPVYNVPIKAPHGLRTYMPARYGRAGFILPKNTYKRTEQCHFEEIAHAHGGLWCEVDSRWTYTNTDDAVAFLNKVDISKSSDPGVKLHRQAFNGKKSALIPLFKAVAYDQHSPLHTEASMKKVWGPDARQVGTLKIYGTLIQPQPQNRVAMWWDKSVTNLRYEYKPM